MKIWNEYPEVMPEKSGSYWVTLRHILFDGTEFRYVTKLTWSNVHKAWNCSDNSATKEMEFKNVVAWAHLSAFPPYLGGKMVGKELEIDT